MQDLLPYPFLVGIFMSVTNRRTDKRFSKHRFRCPNGHTNEEKAWTFFNMLTLDAFFKKRHNNRKTRFQINTQEQNTYLVWPVSFLTGTIRGLRSRSEYTMPWLTVIALSSPAEANKGYLKIRRLYQQRN